MNAQEALAKLKELEPGIPHLREVLVKNDGTNQIIFSGIPRSFRSGLLNPSLWAKAAIAWMQASIRTPKEKQELIEKLDNAITKTTD